MYNYFKSFLSATMLSYFKEQPVEAILKFSHYKSF